MPGSVLLVEDDPVTAELARRGLVRAGFAPLLASSVTQATTILLEGGVVALLVDYHLPDGDPWAVVALAQTMVPRVPAIVVTSMGSEAVAAEAMLRGVAAYLPKSDGFADRLGETVERAVRLANADDEMRRNAVLLRTIADHAHDIIVLLDGTGTILFASAATYHVLGEPPEALIGRNLAEFIHPDDRAAWPPNARFAPSSREPRQVFRCQRRDGQVVAFEPAFVTVGEGRATRTLGVLREVTERLRLEERIRHQQRMEAIGQLTGGLAHDFNNLLGVIIGNLDLLLGTAGVDAAVEELAQGALDAALLGAELTGGLLSFARRQELRPVLVDVNEAIRAVTRLLTRSLGPAVQIELRLAEPVWPVSVDRPQFDTALTNLLTNARDAMPHGGGIIITTSNTRIDAADPNVHGDDPGDASDDASEDVPGDVPGDAAGETKPTDYATIEVMDGGIGMAPEVLNRIFEPFYTTKDAGHGTGLGLAMVFGFIKQSGGHITAHSEPGQGAAFRLHLPRAAASEAVAVPDPPPPPAGDGRTILLVEDNTNLRRLTGRQLAIAGYHVLEAQDGPAALEMIEATEAIDLLLTDVVMPGGLTGYDIAAMAGARRPRLKVLLASGFPDPGAGHQAASRSPHRLLRKPYRADVLLRTVREALDG